MSVWQTPEVSMRTRICPGPGSGIGRSSIARGSVKLLTTAARMAASLRSPLHAGSHRAVLRPGVDGPEGPGTDVLGSGGFWLRLDPEAGHHLWIHGRLGHGGDED